MFDWITDVIAEGGYLAIALLMLAENVFPPIPSELVMPLAGFVAAQGELNPVLVVLAGTVGSVLGTLLWYYVGRRLGRERMCAFAARHGRWLTFDDKQLGKAMDWFERHGRKAVLVGRVVPAVRTLISVPAGITRMPLVPFLLCSAAGTLVWTSLLTAAGFLLKAQYTLVGAYLNAATKVIIGLVALTYLYRLLAGSGFGDRVTGRRRRMSERLRAVLPGSHNWGWAGYGGLRPRDWRVGVVFAAVSVAVFVLLVPWAIGFFTDG